MAASMPVTPIKNDFDQNYLAIALSNRKKGGTETSERVRDFIDSKKNNHNSSMSSINSSKSPMKAIRALKDLIMVETHAEEDELRLIT
jgi:hypothetical protein